MIPPSRSLADTGGIANASQSGPPGPGTSRPPLSPIARAARALRCVRKVAKSGGGSGKSRRSDHRCRRRMQDTADCSPGPAGPLRRLTAPGLPSQDVSERCFAPAHAGYLADARGRHREIPETGIGESTDPGCQRQTGSASSPRGRPVVADRPWASPRARPNARGMPGRTPSRAHAGRAGGASTCRRHLRLRGSSGIRTGLHRSRAISTICAQERRVPCRRCLHRCPSSLY